MFYGCNSLKFLDLSNFTTEKVWKTNDMFFGCNSLKERDLLCKDKDIFDDFRFNKYIKDTYC
jgi:surface protein